MIVQVVLILGLLLTFAYSYVQRRRSRLISAGMCLVSVVGIYLVISPGASSALAQMMGVGRGADLIFYFWIVISLFVMLNLHFHLLTLREAMTTLARQEAIEHPLVPEATGLEGSSRAAPERHPGSR